MTSDLETQLAQMLHRAPHLGAGGAQLLGDACAADDHRCVVAQQAHNATQTCVGRTVGRNIIADWSSSDDRTIMRERAEIWIAKIMGVGAPFAYTVTLTAESSRNDSA